MKRITLILMLFVGLIAVAQPVNDLCVNALPILPNTTVAGTTSGATFDNAGFCGTSNTAAGVWYTWTDNSGVSGMVTLSTCNQAAYDTKISVFTGTCGALICVGGQDDAAGCSGFTTEFSFMSNGVSTYLFLIHGFGSAAGSFNLTFTYNASTVPPVINCPMDVMANTDPGLCTAQVNFADAIAIDPDGGPVTVTQTMGPVSGSDFPIGDTIIEFTATDDEGEMNTCQFTISIADNETPALACTSDITVDNDPGVCGANVTIPGPTILDNCPSNLGVLTNDYTGTDDASAYYPEGTTAVTWTYTDPGGNAIQCTFNVTVNDVEIPTVSCIGQPGTFTDSESVAPGLPITELNPTTTSVISITRG